MTEELRDNGAHEHESESPSMPELPDELGVDPMLAALCHGAASLDLRDESVVGPDAAHAVLEHVGLYVQRLPPERIAAIEADLQRIRAYGEKSEWPEWVVAFVV